MTLWDVLNQGKEDNLDRWGKKNTYILNVDQNGNYRETREENLCIELVDHQLLTYLVHREEEVYDEAEGYQGRRIIAWHSSVRSNTKGKPFLIHSNSIHLLIYNTEGEDVDQAEDPDKHAHFKGNIATFQHLSRWIDLKFVLLLL